MKKYIRIILCIICLLMMAAFCVSAADDYSDIQSVKLIREKSGFRLEVTAVLSAVDYAVSSEQDVYLFALAPWESTSNINSQTPVASVQSSRHVVFTLDCDSDNDLCFAKFIVARENDNGAYIVLSRAVYVENIELLAENTYDYPTIESKKGLEVQLYTDAVLSGTAHTVINVPVNEYIQTVKSDNSYEYSAFGETFYVNRNKLEYLDYRIKQLTDAGCNVYLDFILTAPTASLSDELKELYYTTSDETMASLYGFNIKSENAVKYLEAFVHLLAGRYTMEDGDYGFAGSFIVGYNVNSNRSYNYMGSMSADSYLNYYAVAYRIIDTALRSVYSNGKTYISVNGNFNTILYDSTATITDETLDYSAKDILEAFAEKISYSGDIPWGVYISCYPSDKNSTDFTADALAVNSADTSYISMNNIGIFTDYMKNDSMKYGDSVRNITVNFGISSGENSSSEQEAQAAYYALAYYKIEFNHYIEAGIYHRTVDSYEETGNFGLYSAQEEDSLVPGTAKKIYNVFCGIDTDTSASVTDFALTYFGVQDWNSLVSGFDGSYLEHRKVIAISGETAAEVMTADADTLFNFGSGSMCGFTPCDNCEYIEISEGMLYAKGHYTYKNEYSGIGIVFDEKMSIKKAENFYVTLSLDGADYSDVMLMLYDNSNGYRTVYEGEVKQVASGQLVTLVYDVSSYSSCISEIDGIRLWVRPTDSGAGCAVNMSVKSLDLTGGRFSFVKLIKWVLIILGIMLVLLIITVIILRRYNIARKKKLRTTSMPIPKANHGNVYLPRK